MMGITKRSKLPRWVSNRTSHMMKVLEMLKCLQNVYYFKATENQKGKVVNRSLETGLLDLKILHLQDGLKPVCMFMFFHNFRKGGLNSISKITSKLECIESFMEQDMCVYVIFIVHLLLQLKT